MNEEDIWNKELQAICDMPCCLFRSSFNVGSPTDLTGDPTKRVKLRADIWPDQPDVPAVFSNGMRLSPEPPRHGF